MRTFSAWTVVSILLLASSAPPLRAQSTSQCEAEIHSAVESRTQNPPYAPEHFVTVDHNDVGSLTFRWRGGTQTIVGPVRPYKWSMNKACLLASESLVIEARKCDDVATHTMAIQPDEVQPAISGYKYSPGDDPSVIRAYWRANNTDSRRLRAVLLSTGATIYDRSDLPWVVEDSVGISTDSAWRGSVLVKMFSCNTLSAQTVVPLKPQCDPKCQEKCDEMPECVGDPVDTLGGGVYYRETDPIPSNAFLPFERTYVGAESASGWFGKRWFSMFDASLKLFTDIDGTDYITVFLEDGSDLVFHGRSGNYAQIGPRGPHRGRVVRNQDGSWTQTDGSQRIARTFSAGGQPTIFREVSSGREVRLTWSNGLPASVEDSWGNWRLSVTADATARRVTKVTLDGRPSDVWTYVYDGPHLVAVDSAVGRWRSYDYANFMLHSSEWRLRVVRDGAGNEIERHAYDHNQPARTLDSYGPGGEIESIGILEPGRSGSEIRATVRYKNGRTETHYRRRVAGLWRTVEIVDGCASCGNPTSTVVHDSFGNVIRAQEANGYITETTYDSTGHNAVKTRTALRPHNCDPATAENRCRQNADSLATVALVATAATVETTMEYNDARWPDRVTSSATASVLRSAAVRRESLTFDATTGEVLTRSVSGWTDTPARLETRTTTTTLYGAGDGAAFAPGGSFATAWETLPQPRLPKSVNGPRTAVEDVTTYVYYPVDNAVPATRRGRLAAVKNALGHVTRYDDYDAFGNATRITDANGVVVEKTFDALGRLTATKLKAVADCDAAADPLCGTDLTSTVTYHDAGPLRTQHAAGGGVTLYEYDARARVRAVSRGPSATDLRERVETDYDSGTGKKSVERWLSRDGATWTERKRQSYVYDLFARLRRLEHPDGALQEYTWDVAGQLLSTRDENHDSPNNHYRYDPAGRLIEVKQVLAGERSGTIVTRYAYDLHGNLVSVTDPNGNVTKYVHDDFGQLLSQTSPVTGTTRYTYGAAGQLLTAIDHDAKRTTSRTYDVLNRVTSATTTMSGRPTETVTWTYDKGVFGTGRAAGVTAATEDARNATPSIESQYSWDRRGLLLAEVQSIGKEKYRTAFVNDANGNRSRVTYPSGRVVEYVHDYASRPTSATSGQTTLVSAASYLPFGPAVEVAFGNGTTRSMTYDQRYRMRTNQLTGPLPSEEGTPARGVVASYDYTYDRAGNITRIADLVEPGYGRQFSYDDLGRLTVANGGANLWGSGSYAHDAMGNLRSSAVGRNLRTFSMEGITPKIAAVSQDGRVETVVYDASGNESVVGGRTFEYSVRDHLRAAGTRVYAYDGRGVRTTTAYTVTLSALKLDVSTASPNQTFFGVVALTEAAPAGGLTVRLESSSRHVVVPKKLIVPAGRTSALFSVTVGQKAKPSSVTLTATFATTLTATLTIVETPLLSGFTATPVDLVGGNPITVAVTLAAPAPDGGALVTVTAEREAVAGGTIEIGGGRSSGSTTLRTYVVPSTVSVPLTATYGGSSMQTTVQLQGVAAPDRLLLSPDSVVGAESATGTITLSAPAPAGGRTFTLATSHPNVAQVPSTVTIPENGRSVAFSIATSAVSATTPVVITAADAAVTLQATLTVVCRTAPPSIPTFPAGQTVFIDDALPPGAAIAGVFDWEGRQAASGEFCLGAPYTGTGVYRAAIAGLAEPVTSTDKLFVYARISECAVPRQIVVRAKVAGAWVTAYWGQPVWGVGSTSINMGPIPASGAWARLDVLLRDPSDGDPVVSELELAAVDGQVWFDRIGRMSDCISPTATRPPLPADEDVIVDDSTPAGVTLENRSNGPLTWTGRQAASGSASLVHPYRGSGTYVTGVAGLAEPLIGGAKLSLYALVDTCSPPVRQLHLRITTTAGSRTVSWGEALWDVDGSTLHKGAVPAAGSWSRLEVPLDQLGLDSGTLTRIDIAHVNGRVWFDRLALWPLSGARLTSFVSDYESTVNVGTTVTWTATATGTVYPLQYRFERRDPSGNWKIVQNYGSMNRYTWTPTAADVGGNAIRVSVRNNGSLADFEDTATLAVRVVEGEGERLASTLSEERRAWWKRWFTAPAPVALGVRYEPLATTTTTAAYPRRHSFYTPELQLLAETEISTASKPPIEYEYVWFGGEPLAQIATTTGEIHWYFNDHLGTPLLQTGPDATILWRAEYDPYGTVFTYRAGADKHQPLRFPGQEHDGSTELTYNVFRWYRAGWGRYTQADPIGIRSDSHLFRYAANNPIRATDRLGLFCTLDFVKHYFGRSGTPINLASVGLLGSFTASPSVSGAMSAERWGMTLTATAKAKELCKNCPDGIRKAKFQSSGNAYANPYLDGTPCLGSIGSTILAVSSSCSVTADCKNKSFSFGCVSSWRLRDSFTNPLSFGDQGNPGAPMEILGKAYDILADWSDHYGGGGGL